MFFFEDFPCKSNPDQQARGSHQSLYGRFTVRAKDSTKLAQMPGCHGQSPEEADLASNFGFSGTQSASCQSQPSSKLPSPSRCSAALLSLRPWDKCERKRLPYQRELEDTHLASSWPLRELLRLMGCWQAASRGKNGDQKWTMKLQN